MWIVIHSLIHKDGFVKKVYVGGARQDGIVLDECRADVPPEAQLSRSRHYALCPQYGHSSRRAS